MMSNGVQFLGRKAHPLSRAERNWEASALWRRALMVTLVLGQSLLAAYAMLDVLPYHGTTVLEMALLGLFGVLFAWISAGFWMAVYGFVVRRAGGDPQGLLGRYGGAALERVPLAPTAVVFPIYHEDVERTMAGLRATYHDLARAGTLDAFEFFILSDSRDPEVWLAEQEAWYRLRQELSAHGRIHYRRRILNLNRKTGNIADFLRRWGKRFRYMVVMDADSLMSGAALAKMVRLMECEPRVGILQTSPGLVNAASTYARIQQFANRVYGPLFTEGLAAVQLGDAVFWGHNAILRVDAFMRHCGLRRLRGPGFLGGSILSHDFVEAAQIRRAGYEVWLEPGLGGSYEESPPTLVDELTRDRRWAYGNLQHLHFLVRRRIRLAHRFAFANGIMAYLASPLWFLFLVLSTVEVARFTLIPVDYFPQAHSLFPAWPEWRPQWAVSLAVSTAFLLFTPKLLAFLDVALDRERRQAMGGALRVFLGVLFELIVSVLLAPVRMLAHTRFVLETLFNLSVSWAGQNRTREVGWRAALVKHAPGSVLAITWAAYAYSLKPLFFYWSLPVAVPLLVAAPVTVWLSRFRVGTALQRRGILVTPEETRPPPVLRALHAGAMLRRSPLGPFEAAVLDPWRHRLHLAFTRPRRDTPGRRDRRMRLLSRCLMGGPEALAPGEKTWLLLDPDALHALHRHAWEAAPDSPWGRRLERLCSEPEGGAQTVRWDAAYPKVASL